MGTVSFLEPMVHGLKGTGHSKGPVGVWGGRPRGSAAELIRTLAFSVQSLSEFLSSTPTLYPLDRTVGLVDGG